MGEKGMRKLNRTEKMEIARRTLNKMCLSGDLLGKTLQLSEYLDILVVKEQCSRLGIRGIKSLGNANPYMV